jgi:hypothetical protein
VPQRAIMPDDHCPAKSQVTTVDDQFGTHRLLRRGHNTNDRRSHTTIEPDTPSPTTNSPPRSTLEATAQLNRTREWTPGAWHHTERYANNRIESDHGRLKFRLRPMRGLKQLRCT